MNEELLPPVVHQEIQQPEQDGLLLQRQRLLQDEAQSVLKELNVVELLSAGGVVRQTGSTVLGLMVWHDIDLQVSSPGLSIGHAFEIMHPLLTHPRVKQQRMISTSTSTNATKTFPWPKCSQIFAPRISACWPPPGH